MLEINNSNDSKQNSFLRMLQNQERFLLLRIIHSTKAPEQVTMKLKVIIDQFAEEGVEGACSEIQGNQINKCLCWVSVIIYYLDGHIKKMHRANGFSLKINFEGLAGQLCLRN